MTQSIILQVGQCGNQIANQFWKMALNEHSVRTEETLYDSALSTFFINGAGDDGAYLPTVSGLKARAILIDMEEGVVGELFKGPMRHLYDNRFLITDVSGSGNNWAVGMYQYGEKYHDELANVVRKAAELCDCLQCFFLLHSLGGGTGSGVGTHLLQLVADEYPDIYRIAVSVFPSMDDDDVITSPYNTVLGLKQLTEFADCVLPIDNSALTTIVQRLKQTGPGIKDLPPSSGSTASLATSKGKPFDEMNGLVATMLLNLTCSSRFEGTMNVDINELSMNLVPFPRLHYLMAAQAPVCNMRKFSAVRSVDQIFSDAFSRDMQLMSADPCRHTYLAAALLSRGSLTASDIRRNIDRLHQRLRFVPWNKEGWKVGHCLVPPVGLPYSVLALSNNTVIRQRFADILERFTKLYQRKAYLYHYTNVDRFDCELFESSFTSLDELRSDYETFEKQAINGSLPTLPRLQIAG